ncbi:MAG TPA: hypothetical protein VM223_09055 [Planctomycetota bacterium]|nr:hypothetical protein [Planctomycetota bacterium]
MRIVLKVIGGILIAVLAVLIGHMIHEGGHALTMLALGGKVTSIGIWQVQAYPKIVLTGPFGLHSWVGGTTPPPQWKNGLMLLMGAGSTAIAAYVAAALLFILKPRSLFRFGMIVGALATFDIMWYCVSPNLALPRGPFHVINLRDSYMEPVEGGKLMGIPPAVTYWGAVMLFIVSCVLVAIYVIRHAGAKAAALAGEAGTTSPAPVDAAAGKISIDPGAT